MARFLTLVLLIGLTQVPNEMYTTDFSLCWSSQSKQLLSSSKKRRFSCLVC
ncbi:hypothetical protein HanRHA438_Chr17g0800791 [Helianthus annuus]|nr:hypothetical protein HanRHA438_Chr17g0800791 [Helianthus annuus]